MITMSIAIMIKDQNGYAARNATFASRLSAATMTPTIRAHIWPAITHIPATATITPTMR